MSKLIAVDYSPVLDSPAGIGQLALNTLMELVKLDKTNSYIIYTPALVNLQNIKSDNVKIELVPMTKGLFKGTRWMHKITRLAKQAKVDTFISFSNFLLCRLFPKTIQYVHDLAPLKVPLSFSPRRRLNYKIGLWWVKNRAYKIVTLSETIKQELIGNGFPASKISVISVGINSFLFDKPEKPEFDLPQNYFLTVSTLQPRKNIPALLNIFAEWDKQFNKNDTKLVIVGKKGWQFDEIFKTNKQLQLEAKVVFTDYVDDKYLGYIYSNSKLFFFLSEYEGFGIPPIEALYFNKQVIVADAPIYHETLEELVNYIDIKNVDESVHKIEQVLQLPAKDTKIEITEKYSWNKSAGLLLNLLNS